MRQGPAAETPWIYRPSVDLIVGCAAWSAPLLLFTGVGAGDWALGARGWAVVFYALALVFNYPHYMATVYRAYHTRTEFTRYRIFTLHITALLGLVGIASHLVPRILPWIFTIYVTWSPWHYTGQNFGLLMMFARRGSVPPTDGERRALHLSFLASYILLFVTLHTGASADPLIRSLGFPPGVAAPVRAASLAAFSVLGMAALARISTRASWQTLVAPFTLFTTQALWFVVPSAAAWLSGAQVPQTRYSTGILALMHSAQYLWITSYYARREAASSRGRTWRPWAYAALLTAGGVALFVPGPWLASYLFKFDFTTSVLVFTAVVNIHHFILDGAIWKLRDSRIAALLVRVQPDRGISVARADSAAPLGVTGWLASDRRTARRVRLAAAVALLGLALIDQTRFVLSTNEKNASALVRAAALNPHDILVHARQARLLMEQERFAEAYDVYRDYLSRSDAAGLDDPATGAKAMVTVGLLALRLRKEDEAVTWWERAIERNPDEKAPLPYLAHTWAARADRLDKAGETVAAARAFQQALMIDARIGDRNEGTDWFNYGQFLRRRGVEARLVLACLLKAEALLEAGGDARLESVRQVRAAVERDAPAAARAAREDPVGTEQAALRRY